MKKLFFALVAMFMTLTASAQFQFNPEDMAKRQADRIKEDCQLNDDQYKKVLDYYTAESKAMMARMDSIRNAGGMQQGQGQGRRGWNREEMQKRQEAQEKVLKGILTEEQFTTYKKVQEERMARRRQGGGFGGGFGGGQRQ
ncbi:MAG: DUF4890 domain-containing protein [Bacteroidales bacterium]|nr:DUF4890 domain-containing protein [Bacteroidales bacterium]